MGWFPNKDEILCEVENYNNLSFFKKSKNVLATFVVAMSVLSFFLIGAIEEIFGSGAIYEIAFNLVLAAFIFFNHRWAMIVFCAIYLLNKFIFILSFVGSPISQIIFGAIAVLLTYSSFRVATELKKLGAKSIANV